MDSYKDKKILIFGLGLNQGGVGSAKFFAKQGAAVRVTDLKSKKILQPSLDQLKNSPNISYTLGKHLNEDINWADLIIKNPAVNPGNKYIEYALKKGKRVEQDMGIFLDFVKHQQIKIIGVTGTKGKSTTASLIYEMLKYQGVKPAHLQGVLDKSEVLLAGNIGKSVLDTIPFIKPDTLIVLEISSFQLESFSQHQVSPKWAVITNIYPDHLNYYKNMDEYIAAKRIIGLYQTKDDLLFIRKDDPMVDNSKFLGGFKAKIIRFSKNDLPKDFHPHLKGEHNLENTAGAYVLGEIFELDEKTILNTLSQFKGIPFRMELIKNWHGFKIYNDTTATNPSATIEALKALGPKKEDEEANIILICGGMNKGMDYKELSQAIDWHAKAVYFLEGDVVDDIICEMNETPSIMGRFNNIETLLISVKQNIKTNPYFKKGDIILFSPAATSFNLFQNEFDRGRKFNEAVKKIFI